MSTTDNLATNQLVSWKANLSLVGRFNLEGNCGGIHSEQSIEVENRVGGARAMADGIGVWKTEW